MSIGANIRKRRFELKMTQKDLADAMGYKTRTTIAKIESGENDISQSKLQRIAKILDTTVEFLLSGSDTINLPMSVSTNQILNGNKTSKNIVLIMAGGKSNRNLQNTPNQFIAILGKPIINYCLDVYQFHPSIDEIYIVCLRGWESIVKAYAERYNITKLKGIISAGSTGIISIKNGLEYIKGKVSNDDIVIIQESTRPLVSAEMVSKLLQTVSITGSGSICHSMSDYIQFCVTTNSVTRLERDNIVALQSPEAFKVGILIEAFEKAKEKQHTLAESCCALFLYNLGYTINFIEGSTNNYKVIRQEDIATITTLIKQQSL